MWRTEIDKAEKAQRGKTAKLRQLQELLRGSGSEKTFDAETILKAAIMLNKAERIVHDAIVLLAGAIRISAIEKSDEGARTDVGAVHSLESHWVRAVAREVGCLENEVPFDCPENALRF